jgi:hypothetical protein
MEHGELYEDLLPGLRDSGGMLSKVACPLSAVLPCDDD